MECNNQTIVNNYAHKKFATPKRKREEDLPLQLNQQNMTVLSDLPAKRHQSKGFFRPWLDNEQQLETAPKRPSPPKCSQTPSISQYHANMVRAHTPRQRSPKAQQRRDRNTLACLLTRRAKQAQEAQMKQQYAQYQAQHAAMLEQQLRLSLYYRHILQQAVFQQGVSDLGFPLPEQQREFLQQMSLSQQLMIFGAQR